MDMVIHRSFCALKVGLNYVNVVEFGLTIRVPPSPAVGLHMHPSGSLSPSSTGWAFLSTAVIARVLPASDRLSGHAISCGSDGERIAMKNTIRDAFF